MLWNVISSTSRAIHSALLSLKSGEYVTKCGGLHYRCLHLLSDACAVHGDLVSVTWNLGHDSSHYTGKIK